MENWCYNSLRLNLGIILIKWNELGLCFTNLLLLSLEKKLRETLFPFSCIIFKNTTELLLFAFDFDTIGH